MKCERQAERPIRRIYYGQQEKYESNRQNNFATSAADLGEGLTKSASALRVANNSFEQSIALLTGGTEITQNANEMGSALKVISMRIRGKNICLRIRKVYTPCYA